MKKVVYHFFYATLLRLSNHFNNRLITKCKFFFGMALLVIASSCNEKEEEPEIMCYDVLPPEATCYLVAPPQESAQAEYRGFEDSKDSLNTNFPGEF
jgi:hypothetical protein